MFAAAHQIRGYQAHADDADPNGGDPEQRPGYP
jgi:hypothetical protein